MHKDRDDEMEIDLLELFSTLLQRWYLILVCALIFGAAAFGYTKYFITPQYEASSMIYILSTKQATDLSMALDIQTSKQLTADFEILAKSRPVVEAVIDNLELDTDYETLVKKISVTNPSNTFVLKMTAKDPDPEMACNLSNALSDATAEQVAKVMDTDKPNKVEEAAIPKEPVSPNVMKNTLLGVIGGAFLMCAFVTFMHIMDDRIKTEEDIAKYLELNTLATIPLNKGSKKVTDKKSKKKKSA